MHATLAKLAAVLGVAAIVTFLLIPRTSDEQQIRQLFARGCELGSITRPEPPIERLEKAKELEELFADSISLKAPLFGEEREIRDKTQFRQKIVAGRSTLSSLELNLADLKFQIRDKQALVEATFRALGAMPGAEGQFLDEHRLRIGLVKPSKSWLIQSVEHLENLRE